MKAPKLDCSVIITCYQKEEYLNECMESVKRQTREPKEIILVHDACDNPMAHAIATTIILPKNIGVAGARDVGFKYSTGKLILFVDADDVLSPDYLEKMVSTLVKKKADIVYPDLFIWQGNESYLSEPPNIITKEYIKKKSKLPIPVTSLMKREIYEDVGGFVRMDVLEDMDFFVKAMCKNYIFKKANTLLWYRKYPGSRNSIELEKRKEVLRGILAQLNERK